MAAAVPDVPSNGVVELPIAEYLTLLEKADETTPSRPPPPVTHIVTETNVHAVAESEHVAMELTVHLHIVSDDPFVSIPLVPSDATLVEATVTYNGVEQVEEEEDDGQYLTGVVGLRGGTYNLITCEAGFFTVRLSMMVRYSSQHKTGVTLPLIEATRTSVDLSIPRTGVTIKAEPAMSITQDDSGTATLFSCRTPPTSSIKFAWTQKVAVVAAAPTEKKLKVADEPPVVTSESHHVFLIGEGVLSGNSTVTFSLVNTRRSIFEILLPGGVVITSVDGGANMSEWDVVAAPTGGGTNDIAPPSILRVSLVYPAEGTYKLWFASEVELGGTSCELVIPAFRCSEVSRERGWVGIGAKTSVEIAEVSRRGSGLQKMDVSELPSTMSSSATAPLLHGYKYLSSQFNLRMRVTKHADVAVVVVAIDAMHVQITHTPEGKQLYLVRMLIRNNERQFLRATLPPDCIIWSTVVAGKPVKPATDPEGLLMVPLSKSGNATFVVELVFLVVAPQMIGTGSTSATLPSVDVPVSHLFVTLALPPLTMFTYEESTGDLREVSSFSTSLPSFASAPPPVAAPRREHRMMRRTSISNAIFDSDSSAGYSSDEDDDGDYNYNEVQKELDDGGGVGGDGEAARGAAAMAAGVMPVRVPTLSFSRVTEKRYERILPEGTLTINVPYTETTEPACSCCC